MTAKQATHVDTQVGNRLRLRRMLVGLSQERLGELLGLTFQQVQKYEKGVNRIGAGRLYELAGILGVPVGYFYEGLATRAAGDGEGGEQSATHLLEFLSGGDGLQLCQAFMRIRDPQVRKRVVDLVKSLADEEQDDLH